MHDRHAEAALAAWFAEQGGSADALALRWQDGMRGLFATRDIAEGEVILQVPRQLLLTVDIAMHSPIGQDLQRAAPSLSDHAWFAAFLVETRRHGGFWRTMGDALPQSFPELPFYFDRHDWSLLDASRTQAAARRHYRSLRADFRAVKAALPLSRRISLREFAWGWWASVTRGFSLSIDGAAVAALVPFADMLNHAQPPDCRSSGEASDGMKYRACKPITAGSAVHASYGVQANSALLARYGLSIEHNDADRVNIGFNLPPSHFLCEFAPALVAPDKATPEFDIERDMQSADVLRLFSFLRLGSLGGAEDARAHGVVSESGGVLVPALSLDNERAALRLLIDSCKCRLAQFGCAIEEDERLLASGTLTTRQRHAVMARHGEKKLLHVYVRLAHDAIGMLGLEPGARRAALQARVDAGGPQAAYFEHLRERLSFKTAPTVMPPQALTPAQSRDLACHLHGHGDLSSAERAAPTVIVRGDGMHVWDESGRRYLDAMSGTGNATLGYSEHRLVEAAARQLMRLPLHHSLGNRTTEPTAELAERLVQLAPCPMSKVFFACSGSEANDTAIKLAWHYWAALGQPGRRKILSYQRAIHGSTVATASLSGYAHMHDDFGLPLPGFIHLTCPHHYREAHAGESEQAFSDRLAAELDETLVREGPHTVAALFAEPVVTSAGMVVPPAGYTEKIQAVLRRHGVLLVADEVMTGFGRTGRYWGCESMGLRPDMLVCAKGLTAGYMPMSALLISPHVGEALRASSKFGVFGHGFTQSGNPVAAAVALEALKIYEERGLVAHAQAMGERMGARLRRLESHPLVGQVRGIGMLWAVELVADKATHAAFDPTWGVSWEAQQLADAQSVTLRMYGDSLVASPALIAQARDIDCITDAFSSVIDQLTDVVTLRRDAQQRRAA